MDEIIGYTDSFSIRYVVVVVHDIFEIIISVMISLIYIFIYIFIHH